MKTENMVKILKQFDKGAITEREAIRELKDAEPFDFYAATLELYLEGSQLEKGDSPKISKLFKELYRKDFSLLINDLEDDHPVKRLMIHHTLFEILLDMLEEIGNEIKEKRKLGKLEEIRDDLKEKRKLSAERITRMKIIVDALNHLKEHIGMEEDLIFPPWYQKRGMSDTLLLEDEHEDILKTYERLSKKAEEEKGGWKEKDWGELSETIDELTGELRFHAFHEGDIFYPIVVHELSVQEFDSIKEKMYTREKENPEPSLKEFIDRLNLPMLQKKNSPMLRKKLDQKLLDRDT